jgi:uncharacterized repeat protein (TIGR01451 family)
VGTNLRIQKSGPRILTWTGTDLSPADVTLPARDADVGKTYTYTITVTNTGSATANNVVINENLPAELGFVSASAGGTYDPVLHQVTWDETGLPALASIPPGGIRQRHRHRLRPPQAGDELERQGWGCYD